MWLPLLQLYMKKPEGVKPLFSRQLVQLSLELHVEPQYLHAQMFRLRQPDTPSLQHLRQKYSANPRRLARDVKRARKMLGFGTEGAFYDGIGIIETFETDFRPLPEEPGLTPAALIMILDLYFRLTPLTMVASTPEVAELARTLRIEPSLAVEAMGCFLDCDPCMHRKHPSDSPLADACGEVWRRYGQGEPQQLAALAAQLRDFFA